MAEYIWRRAIPVNFLFIQNKTAKLISQWLQAMLQVLVDSSKTASQTDSGNLP